MIPRVECYAGYRGEETPRAFYLGGRRIEVAEELGRRLAPDHRAFKVRGDDGILYLLRHFAEKNRCKKMGTDLFSRSIYKLKGNLSFFERERSI